jgi:hypothetical protein
MPALCSHTNSHIHTVAASNNNIVCIKPIQLLIFNGEMEDARSDGALSWNMHRALLYWGKRSVCMPCSSLAHQTQTRAWIQLQVGNKTQLLYGCTKLLPRPISKLLARSSFISSHLAIILSYIFSIQSTDSFGLHAPRCTNTDERVRLKVYSGNLYAVMFLKRLAEIPPGTCTCWKFQINSSTFVFHSSLRLG